MRVREIQNKCTKPLMAFFVFFLSTAHAADQTQSQVDAANAYRACMNNAIYGAPGCGDSNSCIGTQRASQYSGMSSVCKLKVLFLCLKWGHKQNSQEGWVAVAGMHLQNAQKCQNLEIKSSAQGRMMIGTEDLTGTTIGAGTASAQSTDAAASSISASSESYDDGAETFGLKKGEALERILKGEKFGDIIASSPFMDGKKPEEVENFRKAGNDPEATLAAETIAGEGTNAEKSGEEELSFGADGSANPLTLAAGQFGTGDAKDCKDCKATNGKELAGNRGLASANADQSKYGGRYGDKTIFQMVSIQYKKKSPTLLAFDFYLSKNRTPAGSENQKDVKSLLDNRPGLKF